MLFSKEEKDIINKLIDNPDSLFGDVIKDYLPSDLSIFGYPEKKKIAIWRENSDNQDVSPIVTFVALFNYLNENRMLLCQSYSEGRPIIFSQRGSSKVVVTDQEMKFEKDGDYFNLSGTTLQIEKKIDNIVQNIDLCSEQLSNLIIDSLFCKVYPTSLLVELRDNGYKPIEIQSLEEQMKSTRKSLCMAWTTLLISLILPFAMTFFNNCHSKSTITDSQMTFFKQQMKNISSHLDSIDTNLEDIELLSSQYGNILKNEIVSDDKNPIRVKR